MWAEHWWAIYEHGHNVLLAIQRHQVAVQLPGVLGPLVARATGEGYGPTTGADGDSVLRLGLYLRAWWQGQKCA